uniref:Uncharacterized protein n=1 Tax=Oryza glaberrima TaxID=4538 RepID=I1QIG9_ORYGL
MVFMCFSEKCEQTKNDPSSLVSNLPPNVHRAQAEAFRRRWIQRTSCGANTLGWPDLHDSRLTIDRQQSGEAVVEIHPQHGTGQPRGCKYYLYLSALQLAIMFK